MGKGFRPYAEYDGEADAIYVRLTEETVTRSVSIDDARIIDYSADGGVVGIEFLGVSGAVDLRDIPRRPTVEKLIGQLGQDIKIFV
ncbi:MAG: DUF2283 domain-containing protein [Chloroflexi bacterium]|nr:DUF2283 domain-containing protein [Chloroflexota bacterium]